MLLESNSLSKRIHAFASGPSVRRILLGLAIFFLLFTVVGYVVLPAVVRSQAERLISDKLDRDTTIGKVAINPFALIVSIDEFKILDADKAGVFASFDNLTVNLSAESLFRLAPVVQEVRLTKPYLHVEREHTQRYNLHDIIDMLRSRQAPEEPARFTMRNIRVEDGRIAFEDHVARANHAVTGINLDLPFLSSMPSHANTFAEPVLSARINESPLTARAKARPFAEPRDATVDLTLNDLDLTPFRAYLPLEPAFQVPSARFNADLSARFAQEKENAPTLAVNGDLALGSVRVTRPGQGDVLKLRNLVATLHDMNVFGSRMEISRLRLDGLEASMTRGRHGRLDVLDMLPTSTTPAGASAKAVPGADAPVFALRELEMHDTGLRYTDQLSPRPLSANVKKLEVTARDVAVDTGKRTVTVGELTSGGASILVRQDRPAQARRAEPESDSPSRTSPGKAGTAYVTSVGRIAIENWSARLEDHNQPQPTVLELTPVSLTLRDLSTASASRSEMTLKTAVNKVGRLSLNGTVGLAPLHTDLAVEMDGVDVLPLQPYVADRVNLRLTSATLTTRGRLQLEPGDDGALRGGFKGDATLGNLIAVDKLRERDVLRWKSLSLRGMDMRIAPLALSVDQVALADFFARVIIDASGRINLQDIMRSPSAEQKTPPGTTRASLSAPESARPAAAPRPVTASSDTAALPMINIRRLTLQRGRVRFTDNFIKPNYTANLMKLGGTVTGLASDASTSANVALHGEVNGAPLSVAGRINPLRRNLFLDIKAYVRGMELASLSPYSTRYMGHGIDKGKLSFEVAYRVEERKFNAQNRLILDQLSIGEKVDSPGALDLPVRLAVALLKDRNGIIDVNVPIGGSIDDPEFSLGGIVLKVIGNAVLKAVTQPFALIGSLFGGAGSSGEELTSLEFDPGRSAISPAGEDKLKTLAKALTERPALTLEITGRFDPETDREGLKRASINRKVRAVKAKDLAARGAKAESGAIVVNSDEYPALLTRAYKDEAFSKPRNLLGLPKALPVEEMEKLMIANAEVDDDDLISLANRRAQAAKDALLGFGELSGDRIYILASKPGSEEQKGNAVNAAAARVDFALK